MQQPSKKALLQQGINNHTTMKTRDIATLSAATCLLCSCGISPHIGGFMSDIGVKEAFNTRHTPFTPPAKEPQIVAIPVGHKIPEPPTAHDLRIYKWGDLYYMELYFQYTQIRTGLARSWSFGHGGSDVILEVADPESADLSQVPVEGQMVLMSKEDVKNCLQIDIPEVPANAEKLIPIQQFDFKEATRCKPNPRTYKYTNNGQEELLSIHSYFPEIPRKRAAYHYVLEPISWPLQAVEHLPEIAMMIPLAIILPPVAAVDQMQQQQATEDRQD